jgi:hypothetical protein
MIEQKSSNEYSHSRILHTSALSYDSVNTVIEFPHDIRGLKILDIGSGESSAVAYLNHIGAKAVGIDPKYSDINSLDRDMDFVRDSSVDAQR